MSFIYPAQPDLSQTSNYLLSNPTEGQNWYNSSNKYMYVWKGNEWVPLLNRGAYAANYGQLSHGDSLPKPVGEDGYVFEYDECIWSTSPAVLGNFSAFICNADQTGVVTAQYRPVGSNSFVNGIANYIIIGIRGNHNRGVIIAPPVPSPTPAVTPSVGASPTPTPAITPTKTPAVTPSSTIAATPTSTPAPGVSQTPTPTRTATPTLAVSSTPVATPTNTPTRTPAVTPSASAVPPLQVVVTDPEGGTDGISLTSFCNIASFSSTNRDSGYSGCTASTITTCNTSTCSPKPGNTALGPVMRVQVSGGTPPYTVSLGSFQIGTDGNIVNPDFENGFTGWVSASGWTITNSGLAYNGTGSAKYNGSGQSSIAMQSISNRITPGRVVNASCMVYLTTASVPSSAQIVLEWYDAGSNLVSFVAGSLINSGAGTWQISSVSGTAPSNARSARISISANKSASQGTIYIDAVRWNLGNNGTVECFFVGGAQVPALVSGALPTGTVKTYSVTTSGSSTPIISMNGICNSGIFGMTGNFMITVTDSGSQTVQVPRLFELYRVNEGSGGGGGTGGGGGGCVDCLTSVLPDGRFVRDLIVGDMVECYDVASGEIKYYPVLNTSVTPQFCYEIISENGSVIQSDSTPMDLPDGRQVKTPEMLGEQVYVKSTEQWETVKELLPLGMRDVIRIDLGNRMFFAGKSVEQCIATHNLKNAPGLDQTELT
jgi:hypothetical protein